MRRQILGLVLVPLASLSLFAADDYRTVATAITAKTQTAAAAIIVVPGHLGAQLKSGPKGEPVIVDVEPGSAAEKMGLKSDDVIARLDGKEVTRVESFRESL